MIIHLSGISAAAKSTIGHIIADKYPNVLVVDFDDFTLPLARQLYQVGQERHYTHIVADYVKFVTVVARQQRRPLLIVGYPDWRDYHPAVPAQHKLFLLAPMSSIISRRASRDNYHSYQEIVAAAYALTARYLHHGYQPIDYNLAIQYIEYLLTK